MTAITSANVTSALGYTPAESSHTHSSGDITNFSSAVETVVTTSSTISGSIATIVADSIESSPTVSGAIESAVESNSAVTASKAVADFYSGHNTVNTLASVPTNKRLVIATITSSTNTLSLSGNTLTDGSEIHIIVKNNGSSDATVTLPTSGGYVSVGNAIAIAAGSTGEINIISDGTNKYVRGV